MLILSTFRSTNIPVLRNYRSISLLSTLLIVQSQCLSIRSGMCWKFCLAFVLLLTMALIEAPLCHSVLFLLYLTLNQLSYSASQPSSSMVVLQVLLVSLVCSPLTWLRLDFRTRDKVNRSTRTCKQSLVFHVIPVIRVCVCTLFSLVDMIALSYSGGLCHSLLWQWLHYIECVFIPGWLIRSSING